MKRLIIVGAIALLLAACSSAGTAAPTTIPPVIATTVATTAASTSTTSSTTSAPTTSSTTPTTPQATTTTTVPTESLIKQAVQDYLTAYHQCGVTPATCDPATFTASEGRSRSIVTELANGMTKQGFYFSTDTRGSYVVAESVAFVSAVEATAVFCAYDAGAVMGPIGPDGLPTVMDDQIVSVRYQYRTFFEGDSWRVGEQQELERLGEGSLCPPAA